MRLLKVSAILSFFLLHWAGASAQEGFSTALAFASATIIKAAAIEEEPPTAAANILELPGLKIFPFEAQPVRLSSPFSFTATAFRVTDEEHFAFAILLPQQVSFNRCTPATDDSLILQNFSCVPSNAAEATGGMRIFKINANLDLSRVHQPGFYQQESSFEVNIIYN